MVGDFSAAHATLAAAGNLYIRSAGEKIYKVASIDATAESMILAEDARATEAAAAYHLFRMFSCRMIVLSSVTASGVIYVGDDTVDKTNFKGMALTTGQNPLLLPMNSTANLWIDAGTNADVCSWVIMN